MSKRTRLALIFMPALLFGLLVLLTQTKSVRGNILENQTLVLQNVPLFQIGDPNEPNNDLSSATSINVGDLVSGVDIYPAGDIDFYVFNTTIAQNYRAELTTLDVSERLRIRLYNGDGEEVSGTDDDTGTSTGRAEITWLAEYTSYYVQIEGREVSNTAEYTLRIFATQTDPTLTPTSTPVPWDDCEINDNIDGIWPGGPCQLSVGVEKENLNFLPSDGQPTPNNDYFTFLAKAGRTYRISTNVAGGADTEMWLYDPSNTQIAYDDDGGTDTGSRIELALNDGWYKILVRDRTASASPTTAQTYDILVEDVTPATSTPTATPGPGTVTATSPPASIPGQPDAYEPNYDFDRASLIGLGAKYSNLNFVPWTGTQPDNDFYKLWVVSGKLYTCETLDLGTATNTNMILYSGPSLDLGFAGNDDVGPFDPNEPYRSRLTFFSSYDGYVFILLGQVGAERVLPEEWKNLTYSLQCYIDQPSTATPTPTSEFVPPTPRPTNTSAPDTPEPSPTPLQLQVRPMTTPQPPSTPTPAATTEPASYDIELLLYYDGNQNGQADPGEGISSALARAYDAISGETLSINFTDALGQLRFQVATSGPVRVSVPFFGFSQVVTARDAEIQIRISPLP